MRIVIRLGRHGCLTDFDHMTTQIPLMSVGNNVLLKGAKNTHIHKPFQKFKPAHLTNQFQSLTHRVFSNRVRHQRSSEQTGHSHRHSTTILKKKKRFYFNGQIRTASDDKPLHFRYNKLTLSPRLSPTSMLSSNTSEKPSSSYWLKGELAEEDLNTGLES